MLRRSVASRFKAAVLLAGCGVYDGSEVTEAVCTLIHLERVGATKIECFAPDALQHHVVNHAKGAPEPNGQRNVAEEAARIWRGPVGKMADLTPAQYDCLLMPGGFGVMKNLSNYAIEGDKGAVRPDVAWALEAFHKAGRPIGAICIAPVILARVLPHVKGAPAGDGAPLRLTMGAASGNAAAQATQFGATMVEAGVREAVADRARRVVSTPAYMVDSCTRQDAFAGIGQLCDALAQLVKEA